jgi:glycosyltransferase involved in cell wall biosynthesis
VRILIVSQYFPPDITAAAFRIYDTAKLLTQANHEVCVITGCPHKAQAEGQCTNHMNPDSFTVCRLKVIGISKGGLLRYLIHYLSFLTGSIWMGVKLRCKGRKFDVIWASSPPLFVGLGGRFLSKLFRCPMVLDIRDIWPDSAVAAGQISFNSFAYRLGKKLERYIYACAAHITCVAEPMRQYIKTKTKTSISIIYNGVSEHTDNFSQNVSKILNRTNCQKNILYAGNLGRVQQLDLLIRAYAEILKEDHLEDWYIRFIGAGAMAENLKSLVSELHLQDRVFIEPPVTHEMIMQKLQESDLLFINLLPDEVLKLTIPSKVFDFMLAGKPILAGISGEGKDILESTGSNICYHPGQINSLKLALKKATANCSELSVLAHKNKSIVLRKYTRRRAVSLLLNIFNNL